MKRAILLVHEWSSGCLAAACSIEKLSLCDNVILEVIGEECVEELKGKSENENTKNVFKKKPNERNFQANLEKYECDVRDTPLTHRAVAQMSSSLPFYGDNLTVFNLFDTQVS